MADGAIVSSILGGFLRGLDESLRETRARRAQVYLQAIQQNPALGRTPEGQAALRSIGIRDEEVPLLFPTPTERLEAAIPAAAAALGQPPAGTTAPPAGAPAAPMGAPVADVPGAPTGAPAAGGQPVSPEDLPPGVAVGIDGQLRSLFQNIPEGTTLEIDPVAGALRVTRRGPDVPSKAQADEPAVYRIFQEAVMALRQEFPNAPDMDIVQRAAAETFSLANKQGLLVPEVLQKIAFAKFDAEREIAIQEAREQLRVLYAGQTAEEQAAGAARGRQRQREAEARTALVGTTQPTMPQAARAGVQPPAPQPGAAPAPGGAPQAGITRMPPISPDMDSPKWLAELADVVQPGRQATTPAAPSGYVIGLKLGEQDIADAASFGLVLARQPTGEWIALPRTVAMQRKLEFEEPAVIAAARAGLRTLKDRTAMQTSAATAMRVLDSVKQTKATSLLVSFGIQPESIQKNPLGILAQAAVQEGKAKVNQVTLRLMSRAGDARAVSLKALQGVATPFIKALGEVGQITEPDKAVIYNLLERVWTGQAFREEADQTLTYLSELLRTVSRAPNITPAMARTLLNTDPRDPAAAEATLQSLRTEVENSLNAPPGTLEAEGLLNSLVPQTPGQEE